MLFCETTAKSTFCLLWIEECREGGGEANTDSKKAPLKFPLRYCFPMKEGTARETDTLWGKSLSNGKAQTAWARYTALFEILCLKKMLKGGSKGDPARISGMQKSTLRRTQPAVWLSCSLWRRQTNLFWHLAVKFTLDETGSVVIPPYIRCQGHWETQALTWLRPKLENP